jgi:protein-disulfide isomerase
MHRRILFLGVLLCGPSACDDETKERVEGLERRLELVEQQQRESAQVVAEVAEVKARLVAQQVKHDALVASIDDEELRFEHLAARVGALEKKDPPDAGRPLRPDPSTTYRVDITDAQSRGSADAKVTIVIFSDFQCPFCQRVQETLRRVESEYGSDVRLVAKHNPLPMHHQALDAAIAAEAAGRQGKFWEMHDLLYEHSRELTAENFAKWAKELKLDLSRFEADRADPALREIVQKHQSQATDLGARGVPAFYINGRFLSGAQPFESFKTAIDERRAEAERLIASGTPAASVYDTIMRDARREL